LVDEAEGHEVMQKRERGCRYFSRRMGQEMNQMSVLLWSEREVEEFLQCFGLHPMVSCTTRRSGST